MKDGDPIEIVHDGRSVPGMIVMISDNQMSALIAFEAILDGHVGSMAVMLDDAARGTYRSIITGAEITLRSKP